MFLASEALSAQHSTHPAKPMTSNLLQGILKHSAHDALVHDKDDSDDELVNVVRSICISVGLSTS